MAMLQVSGFYVINKLTKNSLAGPSEFKITNGLSTNDILKLTALLKRGTNKTLLLEYSVNPFTAKSHAGKQAAALLNKYLLINQLNKNDVSVLQRYHKQNTLSGKNIFNTPLTDYSGENFDNALHYYLASLQKQTTPISNAQYDVINYFLDNKAPLTSKSEDIIYQLDRENIISLSRLRLTENGINTASCFIKREWAKILGNLFGLTGKINIVDQFNNLEMKFEGANSYFATANLLGALEVFIESDVFKLQFSQYKSHLDNVIATVKNGFMLERNHTDNMTKKISKVVDMLKQGNIVYLCSAGSTTHSAPIIVTPTQIISCNKGYGMQDNTVVTFYDMPSPERQSYVLSVLMDATRNSMDEYLDCLEMLIQTNMLEGTPQKTGSCAFSGNKAGFRALFGLHLGNQAIADEISKAFAAFHRTLELQRFIQSDIAQKDIEFTCDVLRQILIFQHDTWKPDELLRMKLIIAELEKEKYPLNVDKFLLRLDELLEKKIEEKKKASIKPNKLIITYPLFQKTNLFSKPTVGISDRFKKSNVGLSRKN